MIIIHRYKICLHDMCVIEQKFDTQMANPVNYYKTFDCHFCIVLYGNSTIQVQHEQNSEQETPG